jgi:hypothetical protein
VRERKRTEGEGESAHALGSRGFSVGSLQWRANGDSHPHFVDNGLLVASTNNPLKIERERHEEEREWRGRET